MSECIVALCITLVADPEYNIIGELSPLMLNARGTYDHIEN